MAKIVRKIRPVDNWKIGENESWLMDMAADGLIFKKMGAFTAKFETNEPQQIRYRIEISTKSEPDSEQLEWYEQSGWNYVSSFQKFHVFSSPEERDAPEIHTDPAEQAFTLHKLNGKLTTSVILLVLATLISAGMLIAMWFMDGIPVYMLVKGHVIQQALLITIYSLAIYLFGRGMWSLKKLIRDMQEGKPMNHRADWKTHRKYNLTIYSIYMTIAIFGMIVPFMQLYKSERATLEEMNTELPVIRLATIESDPQLKRDEFFIDDIDWANQYYYEWSPFAPNQYEVRETLVAKDGMENEGYSPTIETYIFDVRFSFLVLPLLEDLMEKSILYREGQVFKQQSHPSFDQLIISENNEYSKYVFATKNKRVVQVRYDGNASINTIINELANIVN